MRVLQIMRAPVGGLFRHVSDLTEELAARGHEIGIVVDSLSGDAQTETRLEAIAPFANLGIHRMPMPRLLGLNDFLTPLRIRRIARRLGVDILHGHGAKGGFGARLAGVGSSQLAAVYTPHGGALHFDTRKPAGAVFMAIERALLSCTDALIFESRHAQSVFEAKVARPTCRHLVIHNGLRVDEFEPVLQTGVAADFVFVGELRNLKGIDLLIEALADLKTTVGAPASLVMAGDGPDAASLRQRIAELGLTDRVSLVGVRPAREMFGRGRCVVVPSRAESLPYIVLEAAAAGRPMIATQVGGIAEIFGPTADRLIAPNSVSALRSAMQAYLDHPPDQEAAARERRIFVEKAFPVAVMTDRIERLYRELSSH